MRGYEGADFRHMPIGGEQHQKPEQEGRGDQAECFHEPQTARAADERHDGAADVDRQRDGGAGHVDSEYVDPRPGQLPEA